MKFEVLSRFSYETDEQTYEDVENGIIEFEQAIVDGRIKILGSEIKYVKDGEEIEDVEITGDELTESFLRTNEKD